MAAGFRAKKRTGTRVERVTKRRKWKNLSYWHEFMRCNLVSVCLCWLGTASAHVGQPLKYCGLRNWLGNVMKIWLVVALGSTIGAVLRSAGSCA